jgi:hypothetical protein
MHHCESGHEEHMNENEEEYKEEKLEQSVNYSKVYGPNGKLIGDSGNHAKILSVSV